MKFTLLEESNISIHGSLDRPPTVSQQRLTFTIQSRCSKYKDVVCLTGFKIEFWFLFHEFMNIVRQLDVLFCIVAVSTDNHVINRSFFKKLCGDEILPYIDHPVPQSGKLFLLLDLTDNFKSIDNCFVNKAEMVLPWGFSDMLGSYDCTASFLHVEQLFRRGKFATESSQLFEKVSLNPSSISRISPQHALSVFNESTSRALRLYDLPGWSQTAAYIEVILNAWKIVSLKSPSKGYHKRDSMCDPIRNLYEAIKF